MTTIESLKSQAKRLRTLLSANDIPFTHSQSLEAVAVMHGHRDWNTASAAANHQAAPPKEPLVLCVTAEDSPTELRELAEKMLRLSPVAIRFRVDANITFGQVREARAVASEIELRGVRVEFDVPM